MNQRLSQILFFSFLIVSQANFGWNLPFMSFKQDFSNQDFSSMKKALREQHAKFVDDSSKYHHDQIENIRRFEEEYQKRNEEYQKRKEEADKKEKKRVKQENCNDLECKLLELMTLQDSFGKFPNAYIYKVSSLLCYYVGSIDTRNEMKLIYLNPDDFAVNDSAKSAKSVLESLEKKLERKWLNLKCSVKD